MSETPIGSEDPAVDPLAEAINAALLGFTGCIGNALEGICSYSLTFGEMYVPFKPDEGEDCDDEDDTCSQAWVRVTDVSVVFPPNAQMDPSPGGGDGCDGPQCGGVFNIGLEVGVLRCYEVPEDGEAPTATQVMASALQSMYDMSALYQAAMNCEVWTGIDPGPWQPEGPLGGQYGGFWNFTVEL